MCRIQGVENKREHPVEVDENQGKWEALWGSPGIKLSRFPSKIKKAHLIPFIP